MNTKIKMINHTMARLGAALLLPVLLTASLATQAAVVEVRGKNWGNGNNVMCCDAVFEARYGNNSNVANGPWEVSGNDGLSSQLEQLAYTNGGEKNFTLSHSAATGDLIFTIDGLSTPIVLDLPGPDAVAPLGYGWGTIGLMVTSNGAKDFKTTISNMSLVANESNIVASPAQLFTGTKGDKTQSILFTEDEYGFFYDFTYTGTLKFEWGAGKIKVDDLQFMIGVADQVAVPVPAAVWLFGSALGLLGWQHRRKAS